MDLEGIRGTFKTPFGDVPRAPPSSGQFNLENLLVAAGSALAAGAIPGPGRARASRR